MKYYALQDESGQFWNGSTKPSARPIGCVSPYIRDAKVSRNKRFLEMVASGLHGAEWEVVELDSRDHKHLAD